HRANSRASLATPMQSAAALSVFGGRVGHVENEPGSPMTACTNTFTSKTTATSPTALEHPPDQIVDLGGGVRPSDLDMRACLNIAKPLRALFGRHHPHCHPEEFRPVAVTVPLHEAIEHRAVLFRDREPDGLGSHPSHLHCICIA